MITASCIFFGSLPLALLIGDDRIIGWLFHAYLRAWIISLMAWVRHHGPVPRLKKPHLFVANHTSFLDWIILSGRPLSGTVMAVVAQVLAINVADFGSCMVVFLGGCSGGY